MGASGHLYGWLNWNLSLTMTFFCVCGDRKPRAPGIQLEGKAMKTCREDCYFLMVGNSNLTPSMSYSFRPLWLYSFLPFLISLKRSPPILCPGWPNPMPYLPLSFSSPENYIKCHPLHKHSRVSPGLPAAPMVLYTHLLQLLHIVL